MLDGLVWHALPSVLVDGGVAVVCGLLVARWWLCAGGDATTLPRVWPWAAALCGGALLQLVVMGAGFSGETSFHGIFAAVPDVAMGTHPGRVLLWTVAVALLLVAACALRWWMAAGALLAVCVLLRAGTGHAATVQVFSWSQTLQMVHLGSMAVWAGAVMVAGFAVAPRLARGDAAGLARCMVRLSQSSTIAVLLVIASGAVKGYGPALPDWHATLHSAWGLVLLAKIALVIAAIALGVVNRRAVRRDAWDLRACLGSVRMLRAEAVLMVFIIALSGVLGNLPPPGE